jgi:hypothetical protein
MKSSYRGHALPCLRSSRRGRRRGRGCGTFFSSHIRNPNTRRAYREAVQQFSAFCVELGIVDLVQVEPIHVRRSSRCSSS